MGNIPPNLGCKVPPVGWWCSREPGHEGPCAAYPIMVRPSGRVSWWLTRLNYWLQERGF